MYDLSWLNPTPHATAVYASCSALLPPHATLASRRPATALPGLDFHQLIAPALAGAFSFDDLVGAGEQRRRDVNAQHLGGRQVNYQGECRRLLDRQVSRSSAAQNFIHVTGGASEQVVIIRSIRHQPSRFDIRARPMHRRKSRSECQRVKAHTVRVCERLGHDNERVRTALHCFYGRPDILSVSYFKSDDFKP